MTYSYLCNMLTNHATVNQTNRYEPIVFIYLICEPKSKTNKNQQRRKPTRNQEGFCVSI